MAQVRREKVTNDFRAELSRLNGEIAAFQERRSELIEAEQRACEHPIIYEADYKKGVIMTHRPFRVCAHCGYAEEGWGTGYWGLRAYDQPVGRISREEGERMRLRFYAQEDIPKWARDKAVRKLQERRAAGIEPAYT
jgi:hypothetical protein